MMAEIQHDLKWKEEIKDTSLHGNKQELIQ